MKYNQNLFRTVFYNGSNSLKTMLYVPLITRQIRLSLAFQNHNFGNLMFPYTDTVDCHKDCNREYIIIILDFLFCDPGTCMIIEFAF